VLPITCCFFVKKETCFNNSRAALATLERNMFQLLQINCSPLVCVRCCMLRQSINHYTYVYTSKRKDKTMHRLLARVNACTTLERMIRSVLCVKSCWTFLGGKTWCATRNGKRTCVFHCCLLSVVTCVSIK